MCQKIIKTRSKQERRKREEKRRKPESKTRVMKNRIERWKFFPLVNENVNDCAFFSLGDSFHMLLMLLTLLTLFMS